MRLFSRKPKTPEPLVQSRDKKEEADAIELHVAVNDNENEEGFFQRTEQELERKFGKGRPLEIHLRDIKMLRAFRNAFPSLKHTDPENLNFYVINPEFNVAITRAFGLKNSDNITFLTESRGEKKLLNRKLYDTIKGNPERKRLPERQDVVIVMDPDIRPTSRLLKNVAPGGWIVWPVRTANALRARGEYVCKGLLEKEGVSPSVKNVDSDFWKKSEIETDEDLKNAQKEEGVVTYEEAERAVWEAYGKKSDIVKHYKQLIELAESQNAAAIEQGATEVVCTIERDGKPIEILVNVVLPLREAAFRGEDQESFVIFKKKLTA